MGDIVAAAAPIAGGFIGDSIAPGVGGVLGAQLGGMVGGALAGGQQVNQANQQYQQAAQMAQFRPVGITTNFGTSKFGYDEQGRLNEAGYTLAPQLQGYQDQLAGMTGQGLTSGQGLMSLGQQYLGESPDAVRQRYMQQQNALLAPGQEQAYAALQNKLFQTGRGGLATGATEAGGMAATNPELAAYYNALANQQLQLAAGADKAAQQQITFGQGLLTGAYDPFKAGLSTQQGVESLGQGALDLGLSVGGKTTAGSAAAGELLAQQQNPYTTAASSLLSNPQFTKGIGEWFNSPSPTRQFEGDINTSGFFS